MSETKKMITELTPEQRAKMPEYTKKWIGIGTDTARLDPVRTQKTIDNFRKLIDYKVDVPLFILDNPLECWVACALIVENNVAVEDAVAEMRDVILNKNPKKYKIPTARLPWQSGSFFASTFAFYDFMIDELGVEIEAELYAKYCVWRATSELGCIYPLDNVTFVSQKPTEVHLNENNVLHRDGGPALSYAGLGDLNVYSLNGVAVPEYVAVTPEEELDLDYYNKITNADVKAEFVRKVGIERFKDRGKLLDTYKNYTGKEYEWWHKSEYELWDMASLFDGLRTAPFLSMKNITTEIFHFEGVSPQCQDLPAAIRERLGEDRIIRAIA
jgi:hypothetical protein